MLFRFSFPVPRHGEIISITKYFECEHSPSRNELITGLEMEKQEAQAIAEKEVGDEILWREVKNIEGCLYALRHLKTKDLPRLPVNGQNDIVAFCDTEVSASAIRISKINPMIISRPNLRLVSQG